MEATESEVEQTVREVVKTGGNPVVAVPTARTLADVTPVASEGVRLVVAPDALERAGWPTVGQLADAVDDGAGVRTAGVGTLVAVTEEQIGVVDPTVGPQARVVTEPEPDVVARYRTLWREAGDVSLEAPRRSTVESVVSGFAGSEAVADVRDVCRAARGAVDSGEALSVAIWGSAAGEPRLPTLRETVSERLGVGERTVGRRARQLSDSGFVEMIPASDGGAGRPSLVVSRTLNPPLSRPAWATLLSP